MAEPFNPEALFNKAKLFINRSFDAQADDQFDAAALWASLALELLAKWALAEVNPCLIADPSDDGKSLLIAAGASKNLTEFKTIPAKAAYSRCRRAFPDFNADEATRISHNRNEDVHSGGLPFANLNEERWWQRFWREVAVLLDAHGLSVHDLVGSEHVDAAEGYITRNADTVAFLVTSWVEAASSRWEASPKDVPLGGSFIGFEHEAATRCPACGNRGELMGDWVVSEDVAYPEDVENYFTPVATIEVAADLFNCPWCELYLPSVEYIEQAGIPTSFETEVEVTGDWEEYNNE